MFEGKIIKFYREKHKLTQDQLGKDICSVTHISKIECGQTTFASQILSLLSERLGINMELEVKKLISIKQQIFNWHEAIIMNLNTDSAQINDELEREELIQISEYFNIYQLLRARYQLMHNNCDEAFKIIKKIQKLENKLTSYETNLLKHVLGIYFIEKQDYLTAIETLKTIQIENYNNPEYYYHLAIAYHTIQSPVMAYYYAEKSHQFFKDMNNYLRVIDAELIMIIQIEDDEDNEEILNRFKKLIKSCELCNAPDRKAKVMHDLAYAYYRRRKYDLASMYFKESMSFKEKGSPSFLLSLERYIRSSYDGGLRPKDELIQQAENGLRMAINNNQLLFIHMFRLLLYILKSKEDQYYQYLSNKALPMFTKFGFTHLIELSKKELFNYYYNMKLKEDALELAQLIINT